ncbi:MAG TPA: PfkB family carbohydrate kinase, partial [bacterium]|nr:PfkB family carbohydrate kinase [bacterium]
GEAEAVVVDANLHPATIVRAVELTKPSRLCLLPVSRAKATRLRGVLKCASLLITGAPEAEVLTGLPIHGATDALTMVQRVPVAPGTKVVITLGGRGMVWRWDGEASWLDALPAAVVDPTGAGDAVAAVAVYALVRGVPSARAAPLALAAAAMTVSVEGAIHPGLSLDALHARV